MSLIDAYMSLLAFLGALVYYIQAYKVFKKKSAGDLSLLGYLISLFTSINWLGYGLIINAFPLIISGLISTIGSGLVILNIFVYHIKK